MRRRNLFFIALSLSFLFSSACKVKELVAKASAAAQDAKDRAAGPASAAAHASGNSLGAGDYAAPADGHLTGTEVENYIKIRQRAKQYEEAGRHDMEQRMKAREGKQPSLGDMIGSMGAMENVVAADSKAAKDLGYNVGEYEWVRQQMIDASMAAAADQGKVAALKMAEKERAALQNSLDTAPDESSKEIYRGMMADAAKNQKDALAAEEPQSPAVIYNKQLIAKYEDATRPLMELFMKGMGHEDEITKGIKDLQKAASGTP